MDRIINLILAWNIFLICVILGIPLAC